ncbi:hypothetical protein IMZ48_02245 [Candidatus Bathyarchaeota archaeon]|nr:hypothetical protein [Candidatus Bathyarchaeota archaeon]
MERADVPTTPGTSRRANSSGDESPEPQRRSRRVNSYGEARRARSLVPKCEEVSRSEEWVSKEEEEVPPSKRKRSGGWN